MNFQHIKSLNGESGDMVAVLREVGNAGTTSNGKPKQSFKITDGNNETHSVTIFGNPQKEKENFGLPTIKSIGKKCNFKLNTYSTKAGGIAYGGFFSGLAASSPEPEPKQPPQKQETKLAEDKKPFTGQASSEKISIRGFAISYSKDLTVAGKISREEMYIEAARMAEYIENGTIETIEAKPLQATGDTFAEWDRQEKDIPF
jgi:hypothetical protein